MPTVEQATPIQKPLRIISDSIKATMLIKNGQSHLRNGTTITLVNADKSNEPTNNTVNLDKSNEPTNNTGNNTNAETYNLTTQIQKQMQMMQQVIDGQKEAKESREKNAT